MAESHCIEQYLPCEATVHEYGNLFAHLTQDDITQHCEQLYRHHRLPLKMITAFDEREATGSFRIMYSSAFPRRICFLPPSSW